MVALARPSLAVLAWLLSAAVAAQDTANVVRIQCGRSAGSGVYLGDRLVLSCAHLNEGEGTNQVSVRFPSGGTYAGIICRIDRTWDQSAIELRDWPQEAGVRLCQRNPNDGDQVVAAGYDYGRDLRMRPGRVVARRMSTRGGGLEDWFVLSAQVVSGCSGGPVFAADGTVIGNLWGTSPGTTTANSCGRTHQFLEPWKQRLDVYWLATTMAARWGTPSGGVSPSPDCGPGPRLRETPVPEPSPLANPDKVVALIVERLKQDQAFLAAIKGQDGRDGKDGADGRDGIDASTEAIRNQLEQILTRQNESSATLILAMSRLDTLETQLAALLEKPQPPDPVPPILQPPAPQPSARDDSHSLYTPDDLILYYTSRSCPGCERVDERITAMKQNGWPIVITRLSPRDAEVQGVPRMYIPSKDKHVVGVSNCASYLSTLIKR